MACLAAMKSSPPSNTDISTQKLNEVIFDNCHSSATAEQKGVALRVRPADKSIQ